MGTSDIINRLDRDLFKDPEIPKEELHRRLNYLVETLYTMFSQVEGGTITNINVITYAAPIPTPPTPEEPKPATTGISITRVVFDVNGNTVVADFKDGILVA